MPIFGGGQKFSFPTLFDFYRELLLSQLLMSNLDAHTDPIFKELSILKFNDIHLLQLGQFMYSCKSSSLRLKFSNKFLQNSQFHSYNTRNSDALHLPYSRINVKKFSVFFQGPKFYNSLDSEIINTNSIYSFKPLKTKLLITMSKILLASVSIDVFLPWCN